MLVGIFIFESFSGCDFFSGVGLILGGGYSWIADQYGLGIDNVVSFDLVLPNGTFVIVSETNHPEILFGLKGGLNNFGIISGVTMYCTITTISSGQLVCDLFQSTLRHFNI